MLTCWLLSEWLKLLKIDFFWQIDFKLILFDVGAIRLLRYISVDFCCLLLLVSWLKIVWCGKWEILRSVYNDVLGSESMSILSFGPFCLASYLIVSVAGNMDSVDLLCCLKLNLMFLKYYFLTCWMYVDVVSI